MKYPLILAFWLTLFHVNAQIENRTTVNYSEKKLVENINLEKYTEYAPSISADGKTLIFESDRNKGWKLFESKKDANGIWTTPLPLEEINNFGRKTDLIAGPNLSYDGNDLYFFGFFMFKTESEDIFVSHREGDGWSTPEALPFPVNTDQYEGFPSISPDGNTLYFVRVNSANPEYVSPDGNTEPCFELWKTEKNRTGEWGEPSKLPDTINSGCERSPKIMADGETLLFSSIKEDGQGLYDLYQTTIQPDGSYSDIVALDFINTSDNDLSPGISASGDEMYYYSKKDIYRVGIPPKFRQNKNITVQGFVKSEKTNSALAAKINVKNNATGAVIAAVENNPTDGWFSIVLTKGIDYIMEFTSDGYLSQTKEYDIIELESYREEELEIIMSDKFLLTGKLLDEELKNAQNGNVSIKDLSGSVLFEVDSITAFDHLLTIGNTYIFEIQATNYTTLVDTVFAENLSRPNVEKSFLLKPKKIDVLFETVDLSNNSVVKSKLVFKNRNRDERIETTSDKMVSLRNGDRYLVETTAEGYFYGSQEVNTDDLKPDADGVYRANKTVITPIKVGASLTLNGITFESDSYGIKDSSLEELLRISLLLISNDNLVVEISAHSDDKGSDNYNDDLSAKRAVSVVNFLTEQGVKSSNLVAVGYGKKKPLMPNDSEENRRKNRRVELSILEIN